MPLFSICLKTEAPVVQWIEHWSPEPKIWVRLPAGVPAFVFGAIARASVDWGSSWGTSKPGLKPTRFPP